MARVMADDASVFDMTGVSEEGTGLQTGNGAIIRCPTIISGSSLPRITIKNAGGSGLIEVFDIHGRLIKNVGAPAGDLPITWPLDDRNGKRISAGIYFIRYESGNTCKIHKLIVTD